MKKYFLIAAIVAVNTSYAQSDEQKVTERIQQLFTAMYNGDSVTIRSCFTEKAIMQTIAFDKTGKPIVQNSNVESFASFVGKQTKGTADERIQFDGIKVDGDLATAWTPYTFYYQKKFSHCGVNSFTLVRDNGVWKINYIIDTRRKENCK